MSRRFSPEKNGQLTMRRKGRDGRNVPQNHIEVAQPKGTAKDTFDPETYVEWLRDQDKKPVIHKGRRF